MNLSLLQDRVLIEPAAPKDKTPGGIILPGTAKNEGPVEGKVLAVGPGKLTKSGQFAESRVKRNDRVLYSDGVGMPIKVDGKDCLIVREGCIVAVIL
jgi:chaperonin GroES